MVSAIEPLVSLAKPEAETIVALVLYQHLLVYSSLKSKLLFLSYPSISPLLSYFLFNIYSDLLPTYITAQCFWRAFWFHQFHLIISFILLLNSFINNYPSYPLPLTTLLNSYINSFIVLLLCFIFFNSAIFIISLSFPPNFCFKSAKISSTIV